MATSNEEIVERFRYHPADTRERVEAHENVRADITLTAMRLNDRLPESREKSLALTALQEAAMWANAAIAIHLPHDTGGHD